MHVCGTHQDTIVRYGLNELLHRCGIEVIQGPGCPVCVTTPLEIQQAIAIAKNGITIATFGDMIRVPAGGMSLQQARTEGADVRVVYSIDDAVRLAEDQEVVFLAVGFETTAPSTAVTVLSEPQNMQIFSCHRYIPPALDALLSTGEIRIDGILCPGHVSTIIGTEPYRLFAHTYHIPHVVAGFEPLDVLMAVYMIARQIYEGKSEVENEYVRCVSQEGNKKAQAVINEVFEPIDMAWRGFSVIPKSKMKLRRKFETFDASLTYQDILEHITQQPEPKGCACGDVLRGSTTPRQCSLFGDTCTPATPIGPCMVSIEGACNIEYRYKHD